MKTMRMRAAWLGATLAAGTATAAVCGVLRHAGRGCTPAQHAIGGGGAPRAFTDGVRRARLPVGPVDPRPVTEADLAPLPPAAARYFRFMGVVGKPRVWSFCAHLTGRFRRRAAEPWMPCDAWQYSSAIEPARMFWMRILFGGRWPMTAWDTYVRGCGRMRGSLLGVVPVARGEGPKFDTSELVTWLNDAVLMAPSMLLGPATSWAAGPDQDSFDVAVTHAGRTVSARVLLDADGAPRDFWTDDRYADLPGGLVRARWSTPIEGWTRVDGRPRFTRAAAVWNLLDGPFRYAELAPVAIVVNVQAATASSPVIPIGGRTGTGTPALARSPGADQARPRADTVRPTEAR